MSGSDGADAPSILVEPHGDCEVLMLNRPHRHNALDAATVEELHCYFEERRNHPPAALLIKADGSTFCAGFDMTDVERCSDGDLLHRFVRIEQLLQRVTQAPFPIAAFAQGPAIGAGADLYCACALRWAVRSVRLRFPGWGFELALGTRRLARIVGETRARSILLESRWVDADEAMTANLLHAIVEPGNETQMLIDTARRAQHLSAAARASILALTRQGTDDADLAAVVRSAAQPGLRERMLGYRRAAAAH